MRFVTDVIIDSTNITSQTESEIVDLDTILNCSLQVVWTSTTATGTPALQVSNDKITWFTIDSAAINNNNGSDIFIVQENPYRFLRFTTGAVTGTILTLKVVYHGKGF